MRLFQLPAIWAIVDRSVRVASVGTARCQADATNVAIWNGTSIFGVFRLELGKVWTSSSKWKRVWPNRVGVSNTFFFSWIQCILWWMVMNWWIWEPRLCNERVWRRCKSRCKWVSLFRCVCHCWPSMEMRTPSNCSKQICGKYGNWMEQNEMRCIGAERFQRIKGVKVVRSLERHCANDPKKWRIARVRTKMSLTLKIMISGRCKYKLRCFIRTLSRYSTQCACRTEWEWKLFIGIGDKRNFQPHIKCSHSSSVVALAHFLCSISEWQPPRSAVCTQAAQCAHRYHH